MKKDLKVKLGQVGDYEIRLLKVFEAVVECGGFSAAESELSIGRSTISIHIANLEERLDLKLCRRGRGGFSLTEEGIEVYELMKGLFSALESFRSGVNALHVTLTGELRIIASDAICMDPKLKLSDTIARFTEAAPDVNVLLDVKALNDIERMILNDEADIGFIPCHRQLSGLDYRTLYLDPCHLYCGRAHPLFDAKPSTTLLAQVLTSKVVHAGIHTSPEVGSQLSDMNKAAISYFYEARLAMILSGAYIGFMPDSYVERHVEAGELRALVAESKHYALEVVAITRTHGRANRARDLFMDLLTDR
ncbi:LysR family transcriptional regulator [Marinobacter nanhaiticus D15-8W]|uniref:LysR family transcriptional regulator n=1 Tax=Marinobacter nanhaiticus D15-8W TaxID=626887 RepID=N6WSH4_9GAMM|nr:LysR family transcriptional regulator [Marinobacter nanhaiticus]ENO13987.1 LysR family transcriptional regulator [Marinobacter nanhaiticus D15-8W]BES71365.1 LysR family transcriptional regulator [Marinobacter nanhaiticus D15-8W]